jgi:hypothetical protein
MKIFHWIAKARMIISATSIHIEYQQAKANSKTEEEVMKFREINKQISCGE